MALAAFTGALIEAGSRGFGAPVVLGVFGVFAAAAAAFVALEGRIQDPMLPLEFFRSATFSAANTVGLLINLGFYGELFVASLYFQEVRGYSALLTGPRLPMIVGLALGGAGLLGWLVRKPQLLPPPGTSSWSPPW